MTDNTGMTCYKQTHYVISVYCTLMYSYIFQKSVDMWLKDCSVGDVTTQGHIIREFERMMAQYECSH